MRAVMTDVPNTILGSAPNSPNSESLGPSDLPLLDTLTERINWALTNVRHDGRKSQQPVSQRTAKAISKRATGKAKVARKGSLKAIANCSGVPYAWLGGSELVPDITEKALWPSEYPQIVTPIERLEWAYALARKMERKVVSTDVACTAPRDWYSDNDAANRLAQMLRVHALWLQGADINFAKSTMPKNATVNSMQSYLSSLASAGYPFYQPFFSQRSHAFGLRLNFAITRLELVTGHRVDLFILAREASCDIGAIQCALRWGRLQVRLAVRLARYLQVSVVWLHTGTGGLVPGNSDPQKYFAVMSKSDCQGDRMDLALLRLESREVRIESWAATGSRLGIPPSSLSLYRNCLRRISAGHGDVLAKDLQVDADWLRGSLAAPGSKCTCSSIELHNGRSAGSSDEDLSTILGRIRHAKTLINQEFGRPVTWTELASSAGVTVAWFSLYAHGRRKITWHAAQILALGLNVSPHWLWSGEGGSERNQSILAEVIQIATLAPDQHRDQMLLQETR